MNNQWPTSWIKNLKRIRNLWVSYQELPLQDRMSPPSHQCMIYRQYGMKGKVIIQSPPLQNQLSAGMPAQAMAGNAGFPPQRWLGGYFPAQTSGSMFGQPGFTSAAQQWLGFTNMPQLGYFMGPQQGTGVTGVW